MAMLSNCHVLQVTRARQCTQQCADVGHEHGWQVGPLTHPQSAQYLLADLNIPSLFALGD